MKKSVRLSLVVCMLIVVVFLVSCGTVAGGQTPADTAAALRAVQTGSQGVVVTLLPNNPPPLIYDQNELIILAEVRNRGNYNLEPGECFVQVTGFDPNILRGINVPRTCADVSGMLEGKNVYNLEGGFNQLEFQSQNINLPPGVLEYNPTLNFVSCYIYHTTANPSVCVDPLFYQVTAQQKTCIPHDVALGGGQGAPVAVSSVGVDMVGGKGIFEITIQNIGGGRVLSPDANVQSCGDASIDRTDLDKLRVDSVRLGGVGASLDCKPRDRYVRLNNNMGKLICTADLPQTSAFETPLMIDLSYGYIQSFVRSIKIVSTPQ